MPRGRRPYLAPALGINPVSRYTRIDQELPGRIRPAFTESHVISFSAPFVAMSHDSDVDCGKLFHRAGDFHQNRTEFGFDAAFIVIEIYPLGFNFTLGFCKFLSTLPCPDRRAVNFGRLRLLFHNRRRRRRRGRCFLLVTTKGNYHQNKYRKRKNHKILLHRTPP